jgi:hypothetical protein
MQTPVEMVRLLKKLGEKDAPVIALNVVRYYGTSDVLWNCVVGRACAAGHTPEEAVYNAVVEYLKWKEQK